MRATNLLVLLLVMDAFIFFGIGTVGRSLTGDTTPDLMSNGSLYLSFQDYTENSTDYEPNTTQVNNFVEWGSAAAIAVLDTTGVWNIAQPMFGFLNFLVGFITAPMILADITDLNEATFGMISIFAYCLLLLKLLAIWKIVAGRDT